MQYPEHMYTRVIQYPGHMYTSHTVPWRCVHRRVILVPWRCVKLCKKVIQYTEDMYTEVRQYPEDV